MLTSEDLLAIGNIIDTKLEQKLEEKLEQKFDSKLKPINTRLRKIEKTLDVIVRTFDKDIIETKKRVDRIEDHLSLPPIQHI